MTERLTLKAAQTAVRAVGARIKSIGGREYRVYFPGDSDYEAGFTNDLQDAVDTALDMAKRRARFLVVSQNEDGVYTWVHPGRWELRPVRYDVLRFYNRDAAQAYARSIPEADWLRWDGGKLRPYVVETE